MKKKVLLIAVSLLLCAAIVICSLQVTHVTVEGNRTYTAEQIENLIFPDMISRNPLVIFVNGLMGKERNIPFVQSYKVTLTSPVSAEVIVYEKSIVGYVRYMSSCMYFDKDGIVVESSTKKLDGIPEVTGLHFGNIVLYQKLPVENPKIFAMILNLTQNLSTNGIPVDCIRYDNDLNATLVIGNIRVLLGSADEMNGKLSELKNILPEIEGLSGTLDLSVYDPTAQNRMYSFKKS